VVTLVSGRGDDRTGLDAYRGLATRRPGLAMAFTVFLLAQAGVPFTSGFLAKFYVIGAAVDAESYALAIIAMLAAAVSAYLYLRIVVAMYMSAEEGEEAPARERVRVPALARVSLAVAVLVTLVVGLLPGPAVDWADDATPEQVAQD
jgi:NADH-quinone oxidoreductase subunit N